MKNNTKITVRPGLRKRRRRQFLIALLFLAPWAFFFLVFKLYPFLYGIVISFTNYTLRSTEFIGLENYRNLLQDPRFWLSVRSMLFFALICIPGSIFTALMLARLIYPRTASLSTFSKCIIYLPGLICSVVIVVIVKYLFSTSIGVLPWICEKLGVKVFSVFDHPALSIPLMSILIVFTCIGQPVVLYTAAMGGIPQELYDAAAIDGAGKRQIFWQVTFPLLKPTTTLILVTTTINSLQLFVYPMLFTGGGPYYTTSTPMLLLYNSAFNSGTFGYSAAIGVVLFIFTGFLAAVQFRMTRTNN